MNSAIIRGICKHQGDPIVKFPLKISRRNEAKSAALLLEFGASFISVCENDEIASTVDVLVIGMTPVVALE